MINFKPMLAAKANPAKLKFPLYVQAKLDGIRCCIVGGKALTRTLKEVPNREIFAALSRPEFEGLDGELIIGSPTAPDCYRQTASYVMAPDKTGGDWCFHVFDSWDRTKSFAASIFDTSCRVSAASSIVSPGRIRLVEEYDAKDATELERIESGFIGLGHEGVILRDPQGRYKFGRASATKSELLKLKRFEDFEAEVIGVYEELHNGNEAIRNALGRTERSSVQANKTGKDRLGGLILRGVTDYEGIEFRCGTGFSAADRERMWLGSVERTALTLNGKLAKIKHFPVGAKDKPRFPTFIGWRDKSDI